MPKLQNDKKTQNKTNTTVSIYSKVEYTVVRIYATPLSGFAWPAWLKRDW